eukprot:TRINITY_DN14405_c0_g1_i3.p1 TRINITY_DN14405_c0_g1~~TRINITY_DN14405_c0_g1_i3.p1  ORF type:complete len:354 (+),score=57.91 TRINITY_DN14405_c0_g1_i3:130-1191(+)
MCIRDRVSTQSTGSNSSSTMGGTSSTQQQGFGYTPSPDEVKKEREGRWLAKQPKSWGWEPDSNAWIVNTEPGTPSAPSSDQFVLVTYNVWFEEHNFTARSVAMFALLEHSRADVIALQEVTREFLEPLLQCDWVRDSFVVSDATGSTLGGYGVLILVRVSCNVQLNGFSMHELDSLMDRQLVVARVDVCGEPMKIGGVHLESLNSSAVRKCQLETIFPVLQTGSGASHSMLVGDFNFGDRAPEVEYLDSEYVDAWRVTYPAQEGFTMPACEQFPASRLDHVMLRSRVFEVREIRMIGREDIGVSCAECEERHPKRPCTPSDHYGLVVMIGMGQSQSEPSVIGGTSSGASGEQE